MISGGRRVVVTGMSTISSQGTDLDRWWRWLCEAAPAPITTPVAGFDPSRFLTSKQIKRSSIFSRYAVGAGRLAVDDAGLEPSAIDARRGAVVLSTAYAAEDHLEDERDVLLRDGPAEVSPSLAVAATESIAAAMVSADLGWRGPSRTVIAACAGGTDAVIEGAQLVAQGRADAVLAGGVMGPVTEVLLASYRNLRVYSPSGWLRPFDRRRDGFVFAEGAAALVLEPLDAARARGARIYAEVLGGAETNDAGSLVSPTGSGATECIEGALADAGAEPGDVAHINAHGTGTIVNDRQEAIAIDAAFGSARPAVSSIKGTLGHGAAASGAFEAVASALTIHTGIVPTLGHDVDVDPPLAHLDLVVGPSRAIEPGIVLSNSFGLGGHNGCLVLGPVR